jgi:hypothetical protein
MKINNYKLLLTKPVLIITTCLGATLLLLYTCLAVSMFRARIINVDNLIQNFVAQSPTQLLQSRASRKIVVQRGFNYDKGLDKRCLTWSSEQVGSGWTQDSQDRDFYIDYYVPPNSKAIICTTPALAGALKADSDKPFLYEVYPTDYGLMIRIIVGISEVREPCQKITGNVNCLNSWLEKQAIVHYQPK